MSNNVREKIIKCWDNYAKTYDQDYGHGIKSKEEKQVWKVLLNKLLTDRKLRILDIGTGTGNLAFLLAELGHEVKGVDISEKMLEQAKKKALKKNIRIAFAYGDAESLPAEKDNTYDVVISRYVLWTIEHPSAAFSEWHRILKPGGKLIIIDGEWFSNKPSYHFKLFLGRLLTLLKEFKWQKVSSYDEQTLKALPMPKDKLTKYVLKSAEESGFKMIKVYRLSNIEKAEKHNMPLKDHLMNPYSKFAITAIKS